jgi:hypothetical protein
MIDFMVLALPRSGTAWVANLLTTDTSLCIHEAFMDHSIDDLDTRSYDGMLGIAETSAFIRADELNLHSAKKLIIDRPFDEINNSIVKLGFKAMPSYSADLMIRLKAYRIAYKDLFNYDIMAEAYYYLLRKELNQERHKMLCQMNIEDTVAIERVRGLV